MTSNDSVPCFSRKLSQNAFLTVVGLLLVGAAGWLVSTTIENRGRLLALERDNQATAASVRRVESDVTYVRSRIDEMVKHLLASR